MTDFGPNIFCAYGAETHGVYAPWCRGDGRRTLEGASGGVGTGRRSLVGEATGGDGVVGAPPIALYGADLVAGSLCGSQRGGVQRVVYARAIEHVLSAFFSVGGLKNEHCECSSRPDALRTHLIQGCCVLYRAIATCQA